MEWGRKNMKLFIREHFSFIVLQCFQFLIMFLIMWMAGVQHIAIILYAISLSFFFLSCYFVYRYMTRRRFYNRLEKPLKNFDESLQKSDQVPVAEALDRLLKSQYSLYQERIGYIEMSKEEHLTFIDRWVHQMKTPLSVIELT